MNTFSYSCNFDKNKTQFFYRFLNHFFFYQFGRSLSIRVNSFRPFSKLLLLFWLLKSKQFHTHHQISSTKVFISTQRVQISTTFVLWWLLEQSSFRTFIIISRGRLFKYSYSVYSIMKVTLRVQLFNIHTFQSFQISFQLNFSELKKVCRYPINNL